MAKNKIVESKEAEAEVIVAPEVSAEVEAPLVADVPVAASAGKISAESDGPMTKAKLKAIIDAYKVANPAKYELKKDELEAKLAKLK